MISTQWRQIFFFFFHVLFFLSHVFKVSWYNAALHLYFQMLLSHHSLIPSLLLLSALRYFADTVYPYTPSPRTFDHLYSQSRWKFTAVHSYFLYFKPAFGALQMNEGVEVVSACLSWDHLAHLIKHRRFNLAFSYRRALKTTSTSSSLADSRQTHTQAQTPTCCRLKVFINDTEVNFCDSLCAALSVGVHAFFLWSQMFSGAVITSLSLNELHCSLCLGITLLLHLSHILYLTTKGPSAANNITAEKWFAHNDEDVLICKRFVQVRSKIFHQTRVLKHWYRYELWYAWWETGVLDLQPFVCFYCSFSQFDCFPNFFRKHIFQKHKPLMTKISDLF